MWLVAALLDRIALSTSLLPLGVSLLSCKTEWLILHLNHRQGAGLSGFPSVNIPQVDGVHLLFIPGPIYLPLHLHGDGEEDAFRPIKTQFFSMLSV